MEVVVLDMWQEKVENLDRTLNTMTTQRSRNFNSQIP